MTYAYAVIHGSSIPLHAPWDAAPADGGERC